MVKEDAQKTEREALSDKHNLERDALKAKWAVLKAEGDALSDKQKTERDSLDAERAALDAEWAALSDKHKKEVEMSKRIVRKPHNDKIVEMLEDIACNRDDFDLVKCAAEIREIVKTELQNETRRIVNDKGYLQISDGPAEELKGE